MAVDRSGMKRSLILIALLFMATALSHAQGPVINSVSDSVAYPGKEIVISGSGFNPDTAKTKVWFGQVKGRTISSTAFSVVARVPAQARLANLEVINTGTGLSVKTDNKFLPFFSGGGIGQDSYPRAGITASGKDFRTYPSLTSSIPLFDICSCDLDGDGRPEAIASRPKSDLRLLILRNIAVPGTLDFVQQDLLINFPIQNLICGDVDGDGKPDLLASKSRVGTSAGNAVYVLRNKSIPGTIQFEAAKEFKLPANNDEAGYLVLRDLNLDGRPDLVVSNSQVSSLTDLPLYIFVNESSPGAVGFQSVPIPLTASGMKQTYGLEIQDFTGDDKPDIAVADKAGGTIRIFPNTSSLAISFGAAYSKTVSGTFINRMIAADFNSDGRPDLAVTDITATKITLLYNTSQGGEPALAAPVPITTADSPDGIDVGDLDGDMDADMAVACKGSRLTILLNSGTEVPTFTRFDYATQRDVRTIVAADMDGDAKPDLSFITFKLNSIPEAYSVDVIRNLSCFVPRIVNEQPLTNCLGPPVQPVLLRSIPGFGVSGYVWKLNGGSPVNTAVPFAEVTAQGQYTVTAAGECGAGTTSPAVTLTSNNGPVPPQPVITSNSPVCQGGGISLSTPAVAGTPQYIWTRPDGTEVATATPTLGVTAADAAKAGQYKLQIRLGFCRSEEVSTVVNVVSLSDLEVQSSTGVDAICQGAEATLVLPELAGFSYRWFKGGVEIAGQTLSRLSVTDAGAYTAEVSYPAVANCKRLLDTPVNISFLQKPIVGFTAPAVVCAGAENTFTDSSVTDPAAGSLITYLWNFGTGGTSILKQPPPVTFAAASPGLPVSLKVSYTGVAGCDNIKQVNLPVLQAVTPVIQPSSLSLCPDESATLTVSGALTNLIWSNQATGTTAEIKGPATYSVTGTDAQGCRSKASLVVAAKPVPPLTASGDPLEVLPGGPVALSAVFNNALTYVFSWTPAGTVDDADQPNTTARPLADTDYVLMGEVSGQCIARDTVKVKVSGGVTFPNVFSPNNDGVNDRWELPGVSSFSTCILSIFDRSGMRVFEMKGYDNKWDGTWNGKPLPEGTYYFIMGCPDRPPVTGNLLIAR